MNIRAAGRLLQSSASLEIILGPICKAFRGVRAAAVALLLVAGSVTVHAQSWPTRPVKVFVPYPAGGTIDPVVRFLVQRLQTKLGQPFIVENRPGAAAIVGAQALLLEPRDGHALFTPGPSPTTWKAFNKDAPVDLKRDLEPITQVFVSPYLIVTNASVPAKTLPEFIAYARANPGKLNYGSANGGSIMLDTEWFKKLTGTDIVHVPYKGGADMRPALLDNQIQLLLDNSSFHIENAKLGKLRILAVVARQRMAGLPEVPTAEEAGLKGFVASSWTGLFVATGTRKAVVDNIYNQFHEAMASSEFKEFLNRVGPGNYATEMPPAEFARFLDQMARTYEDLVTTAGVKVN